MSSRCSRSIEFFCFLERGILLKPPVQPQVSIFGSGSGDISCILVGTILPPMIILAPVVITWKKYWRKHLYIHMPVDSDNHFHWWSNHRHAFSEQSFRIKTISSEEVSCNFSKTLYKYSFYIDKIWYKFKIRKQEPWLLLSLKTTFLL